MDERQADTSSYDTRTLAELQALLATKEREAEALSARLGEMWSQRQQGTLPRESYPDYFFYEDQLRVTLQEMERLQPQIAWAGAVEEITTGKAHHDRYCALIEERGQLFCAAWETFVGEGIALQQLIDEQSAPLVVLRRADGHAMFELANGPETLQNMLNLLPGAPRLQALHVGQAREILGHLKGREPFSETNVQRFLAEYRVKEPQPAMEE